MKPINIPMVITIEKHKRLSKGETKNKNPTTNILKFNEKSYFNKNSSTYIIHQVSTTKEFTHTNTELNTGNLKLIQQKN